MILYRQNNNVRLPRRVWAFTTEILNLVTSLLKIYKITNTESTVYSYQVDWSIDEQRENVFYLRPLYLCTGFKLRLINAYKFK